MIKFKGGTVLSLLRFLQKMVVSVLGWLAAFLNRNSREHRYMAYVLEKEKNNLKQTMKEVIFV